MLTGSTTRRRSRCARLSFAWSARCSGAEAVCWDLDAYRSPGYQPSGRDIDKIVDWFKTRTPGAVIVPPASDAHLAHRMTRSLVAVGLLGANLVDTLVLDRLDALGAPTPSELVLPV